MSGAHRQRLQLWPLLLYMLHVCLGTLSTEVKVLNPAPGYKHALTAKALQPLISTCLDPDLAPHEARLAASPPKPYQLSALASTIRKLQPQKYYKHNTLVTIRGGRVFLASFAPGIVPSPTPRRISAMQAAMERWAVPGLPDCVFIMNTWDEPRCPAHRPAHCDAPVLSLIKQWDAKQQASMHTDILVPFFNHVYEDIVEYPWDLKQPKALMRAAMQNGMPRNCTRMWLRQLASRPGASAFMDVGITNNLKVGLKLELSPFVSMPDHAKFKFLISADGFTASCRVGKLLGVNSVLVKEESRWVEYYYRALQPGQHYLPFTKQTAWQVLQSLPSRDDTELQAIAVRAQAFQQTFLSNYSKVVYMREALLRYVTLFGEGTMAAFVAKLPAAALTNLTAMHAALQQA